MTNKRLALAFLMALGLALLVTPLALAQDGPISNDTCLTCHGQPDQHFTLPSGEVMNITVDPDVLSASVHGSGDERGQLRCQDCHTDIQGYPHGVLPARDHRDLQLHYAQTCANCHEEQALKQVDSVHARVLAAGVREAAVCTDCHGSHEVQWINRQVHPDVPITAQVEMCRHCHSTIHQEFKESVHGRALYAGNEEASTCLSCHPAHTAQDPRTLEFRLHSPEMCGTCHADKEMMAKYGISTEVFETYVADFHGTTVMLFERTTHDQPTNKAVCADCHGAHNIQTAKGDDSVMKAHLVEVCQECHPDATASFASSWLGHYNPDWNTYPLVTAVTWFYYLLIPAMMGFFLLYIVLDGQRRIRNRRAQRKGAPS